MALIAWPALLPAAQRAGNSRSLTDPGIRSTNVNGPPIARQRTARTRAACPLTLLLSDDQLAYYDAFWHLKLAQGCAWLRLPLSGEGGVATVTARLAGGYQADQDGGWWHVTLQAELDAPELG
jgi:hypothetical protein